MYGIPRPKGMSWRAKMRQLAEKYPEPSSVPGGVPMVPGTIELQQDWRSWAKAWRAYYDSTAPRYLPPTAAVGKPRFPPPGSSDEAWGAWSKAIAIYYNKYPPLW